MSNEPEVIEPRTNLTELVLMPSAGTMMFQPVEFTEDQKQIIKKMCQAEGLTDDEFAMYLHVCKRRRLDPILRQIYATKRKVTKREGNREWKEETVVIMTAIEGLTAIADRTGTYAPSSNQSKFEFAKPADKIPISVTIWLKKFVRGEWHEFPATDYWEEYNQDNFMWRKMGKNQLEKCCRAKALRQGWPEDCGGIYIPEEFNQEVQDETPKRKERERGSISKLHESKEENRGHGAEGIKEALESDTLKTQKKRPLDQYSTSVEAATLKKKADKQWVDVKVMGGTAYVWNEEAMKYHN